MILVTQNRSALRLLTAVLLAAALTCAALFLSTGTAHADIYIAQDDFEGHEDGSTGHGWMDEWVFKKDAGYWDGDDPYEGESHLRLSGSGASATRTLEVAGEPSLKLQVWVRAEDFDDGKAVLEVSNNGRHYVELHHWHEDDDEDRRGYRFFEFDLTRTDKFQTKDLLWIRARIAGGDDDDDEDEKDDEDGVSRLFIDNLAIVNPMSDPDPPDLPFGERIVIDGEFDDWVDKAHLDDALGDQKGSSKRDIAAFYWANNIDQEINFHMLERHTKDGKPFNGENGQSGFVRYIVFIDTNNNGVFGEKNDRRAVVTYVPKKNSSKVNVKIYAGSWYEKISDSGWHDWGESRREGGLRVEFPLDWRDLDIQFGDVIRMYAVSFVGLSAYPIVTDRVPDGNADIQWTPASVLGPWVLGAVSVAGVAVIWYLARRRRLWT